MGASTMAKNILDNLLRFRAKNMFFDTWNIRQVHQNTDKRFLIHKWFQLEKTFENWKNLTKGILKLVITIEPFAKKNHEANMLVKNFKKRKVTFLRFCFDEAI